VFKSSNLTYCLLLLSLIVSPPSFSANKKNNPHYTEKGFFDIHVCNWPDRAPFLLAVFSSLQFNEIKSVKIITPDSRSLGQLDLNKFRTFTTEKNNSKKHLSNTSLYPNLSVMAGIKPLSL